MSNEMSVAELRALVETTIHDYIPQPYERFFAIKAGWKSAEFDLLYRNYLTSTQVDLKSRGNKTTEEKGNPLEDIARYFLEKGGIVNCIKPGGIPNRWQVDGIGEVFPDRLDLFLGNGAAQTCGPCLFMEAKNHDSVLEPNDWAHHCQRMEDHDCRLGVFFSTGGYAIGRGFGYARSLFHQWLSKKVHILLSVVDLKRVAADGDYPWAVIRTAFLRQKLQEYEQASVQSIYSANECLGLARSEYERLTSAWFLGPAPVAEPAPKSEPAPESEPAPGPVAKPNSASGPALVAKPTPEPEPRSA